MTAERTSSVMALLVGMLLGLASRKSADSTEESNADRQRCRAHKGNDMKRMASVRSLALAALALLAACEANAVAFTGGVVSLVGGSGSCNKSQLTPLDTPQDTFSLVLSTGCSGGAALGELRSDASSTSVGLHVAVSGTGAQAAAQVGLIDTWTIGVPVGTATGSVFSLPAAFRLEGDIAPGSTFLAPQPGRASGRSRPSPAMPLTRSHSPRSQP